METIRQQDADENAVRKLLMVSHAFPPTGGSGVQRSVKFAKYLGDFGWRPVVLASDRANGLPIDPSLEADLPSDVRVVRNSEVQRSPAVGRTLRGVSNARRLGGLGQAAARFATAVDWRLKAYRQANAFPDDCATWARVSFEPAMRLIESECVDAIYSTYSPVSNHTLAMELKRATGLPWVADFRDLWTDDPRYCESSPKRRRAARDLERQIIETADAVVAVSPMQRDVLASRVPGCDTKFVTITNGYDPSDFADADGVAHADRFVLAHVGRLDAARTKPALFEALASIGNRLGQQRKRFVLRVVGHCNRDTRAKLEATGISVEVVGYVSHAEAIAEMMRANALLALLPTGPNAESIICGKLFEYLATGNPILVVGPSGGECDRIVRECDAGIACEFISEDIVDSIRRLFVSWASRTPMHGCEPAALRRYSRVATTGQLANALDGLAPVARGAEAQHRWEVAGV